MAYGLGNFLYDLEVKDGKALFHFYDPDDAANTAEVEVAKSDFPEGITKADSRQVADLAYAQCSKVLNDKRDARIRKEEADQLATKQAEDQRQREEAEDFFNSTEELANTTPTGGDPEKSEDKAAPAHDSKSQDSVEDDSKRAPSPAPAQQESGKDNKKGK